MRYALSGLVLGFLLCALASTPRAQCPTNVWDACGVVTNPPGPTFQGYAPCGYAPSPFASFDLRAGTLYTSGGGGSDFGSTSRLTTEDAYRIDGPASAIPIAFSANLTVLISLSIQTVLFGGCSSAGGTATLSEGQQTQTVSFSRSFVCGYFNSSGEASLTLSHVVGEQFHLVMEVYEFASAAAGASAQGTLTFGLPPGYSVSSCQGYSQVPTPSRPTTWGRLKVMYR